MAKRLLLDAVIDVMREGGFRREHKINTQTNRGFYTCADCAFKLTCGNRFKSGRWPTNQAETIRCSEFEK